MAKNLKVNTDKKDTGTGTGQAYTAAEKGKDRYRQQDTASKEEQEERAAELRTQGRKGCKAKRINLVTTPENYEYISIMSRGTGRSMSRFVNDVVEQFRNEHPGEYETIAKALESMNM